MVLQSILPTALLLTQRGKQAIGLVRLSNFTEKNVSC